jgi:7-cyano-7-deazaguanine synthase
MATAVLLSGGLDSAVLLADEVVRARDGAMVYPVYVSAGLAWERAEREIVARLLAAPPLAGRTAPLASLTVDMQDVYAASHWAVAGRPPAYHTPDEDVYLPGRNVVLLAKAGIFAAVAKLDRIVMGTLGHNPFPDATPAFRTAMAAALTLGLARDLRVDAPYAEKSKAEVIRRGVELGVPFELTLSCMNPKNGVQEVQKVHKVQGVHEVQRAQTPEPHEPFEALEPFEPPEPLEPLEPFAPRKPGEPPIHCGTCSKCRERHDAFLEAGLADPTRYADERFVGR